jgi:hypothetical protein
MTTRLEPPNGLELRDTCAPFAPFGDAPRRALGPCPRGREPRPDAPFGCARDTLRVRKRGRDGLRSALTVPHAGTASFREAHMGRCPGVLPGVQRIVGPLYFGKNLPVLCMYARYSSPNSLIIICSSLGTRANMPPITATAKTTKTQLAVTRARLVP